MMQMSVQHGDQCGSFNDDAYAGMSVAMNAMLVALLRLKSVDGQNQIVHAPIGLSRLCRVLMPGRHHALVQVEMTLDRIVRLISTDGLTVK